MTELMKCIIVGIAFGAFAFVCIGLAYTIWKDYREQ